MLRGIDKDDQVFAVDPDQLSRVSTTVEALDEANTDLAVDETAKIFEPLDRAINPGAAHLKAIPTGAEVILVQDRIDLSRDARALVGADAARPVNVQAEDGATRGQPVDGDEIEPEPLNGWLQQLSDVATNFGRMHEP